MGTAVENHKKAHASFHARDWAAMGQLVAENLEYEDKPRGLTMKNRSEFVDWLKDWTTLMSDAEVGDPEYIDGGSWSVARFTGRGLNDGAMGSIPATGKRLSMPFCEVMHWTDDGQCDRGEIYYDAMTMMVQLGVMEPPPQ